MNPDQSLTIANYKEPLKKVEKGYGYYGTLAVTLDGGYVQCHECGRLFQELTTHVKKAHNLTSRQYKDKFQLAYETRLISEKYRKKMKDRWLEWFSSLTAEERKKHYEKQKEALRKASLNRGSYQPKHQLETKNKRGTCPDQLLEKILEVKDKLGRVPSQKEFVAECGTQRYKHLIYKTFGSWSNALKMLKVSPKEHTHGVTRVHGERRHYTNEELLEYLRIFAQEERKVPTYTDFARGLLPTYGVYTRHFGRIEVARREAGVYDILR